MSHPADPGAPPGDPGAHPGIPGTPSGARAPGKRAQLNRALSKLGLGSRGDAGRWIAAGKVKVNGEVVTDPEQWVDLGLDRIEADIPSQPGLSGAGHPGAGPGGARRYLRMHKPAGYVTTRSDELGRKTVYDLLPEGLAAAWVFPVGRLDKDSEGLLLLTDDGEWADRLTDPAFHVEKRYRVKLDGRPREEDLAAFREGIELEGRKTFPAEAVLEKEGGAWCLVTLREGRNRQIRRMFHALGYKVKRLVRVSIGPLELGDQPPGEVRVLEPEWVEALAAAGEPKQAGERG